MIKEFTFLIFTENTVGLLTLLTMLFTRRKLNIDSLTTSESGLKGVYRFTIVSKMEEDLAPKVTKQMEKQIGVFKAFYSQEEDIIHQEIALYKLPISKFKENEFEEIIRKHHATVLAMEKEYIVISKTGYKSQTQELYDEIRQYGILQFARSGRVAITKPKKKISEYLKKLRKQIEQTKHQI